MIKIGSTKHWKCAIFLSSSVLLSAPSEGGGELFVRSTNLTHQCHQSFHSTCSPVAWLISPISSYPPHISLYHIPRDRKSQKFPGRVSKLFLHSMCQKSAWIYFATYTFNMFGNFLSHLESVQTIKYFRQSGQFLHQMKCLLNVWFYSDKNFRDAQKFSSREFHLDFFCLCRSTHL